MEPDIKRLKYPVTPREWDGLLARMNLGSAEATRRQDLGNGRPTFSPKVEELILQVRAEGEYCVIPADRNMPVFNKELARVKAIREDGVFRDGDGIPKGRTQHYVKLCPGALAVSDENMKVFPEEAHAGLSQLASATCSKIHILIWNIPGENIRRPHYSHQDKQQLAEKKKELLGDRVPDQPQDDPRLVVVVSARNRELKLDSLLQERLASLALGRTRPIVLTDGPIPAKDLHRYQHLLHSCLATVIWIDKDVSQGRLALLAHAVKPSRLFLLYRDGDGESREKAERLASDISLDGSPPYPIEVPEGGALTKDALNNVVNQVKEAIDLGILARTNRDTSWMTWNSAKLVVERMLDDRRPDSESNPEVDAKIVETALLAPFHAKVVGIRDGNYSSTNSTQAEFVSVTTPLYRHARRILAMNTDRHSQFWKLPEFERKKDDYLTLCPTVRLFLFSDIDSLFSSIGELDLQETHYRIENDPERSHAKLLVASSEKYKKIFDDELDQDVAFIELSESLWYRFYLSEHRFGYERYDAEPFNNPLYQRLLSLENAFRKHRLPIDPPSDFPFFPWSDGLTRYSEFESWVRTVFGQTAGSRAHCILSFRNDGLVPDDVFGTLVQRAHDEFKEFSEKPGHAEPRPRSVGHGSLLKPSPLPDVRDGSDVQPQFECGSRVIMLGFEGYEALQDFRAYSRTHDILSRFYRAILVALGGRGDLEAETAALVRAGSRYLTIQELLDQRDLASMITSVNGYRNSRGERRSSVT